MGMTRRGSRWLGSLILSVGLGLSALVGVGTLDALISSGLLFFAGLAFVLAGFETPLTKQFGWHRVFALGFFAIALLQLTDVLSSGIADGGILYAVATLSLAGLFAFMGVDIARGGPHFDVDPDETV